MQLYLIRHGQSTNNVSWERGDYDSGRVSDPGLTDLGKIQAETLGRFIASTMHKKERKLTVGQDRHEVNINQLYCSLMIRAIQTGSAISEATGLPLIGLKDVHEIGGIYLDQKIGDVIQTSLEYGVNPAWLQKNHPGLQLDQEINEAGWWKGGKEPDHEPLERARRVLDYLLERHSKKTDRVGIVTHGGFFNSMVRVILNIQSDEPDNRKIPLWVQFCNCGISRFDFNRGRVEFVYHNRTDFFDEDLISC